MLVWWKLAIATLSFTYASFGQWLQLSAASCHLKCDLNLLLCTSCVSCFTISKFNPAFLPLLRSMWFRKLLRFSSLGGLLLLSCLSSCHMNGFFSLWGNFSASRHTINFLLLFQPLSAQGLVSVCNVLSLLVMGRGWCLLESSFTVRNKTYSHQMPFFLYINLFPRHSWSFSSSCTAPSSQGVRQLWYRNRNNLLFHSTNHEHAQYGVLSAADMLEGQRHAVCKRGQLLLCSNATQRWMPLREAQ